MRVFMIGGTGLLGSEGARQLIERGHEVVSIALDVPQGAPIPPQMELEIGNYLNMSDDELRRVMAGCDAFVFAAGVDERVEGPAPIYGTYKKFNIDPVRRLLGLAKECGVKHAVILGSYFAYFAKQHPEMQLERYHQYIRSRLDQEEAALSFAGDDFDVAVLELPYIFGTQPGRRPVWMFVAEQVRGKGNLIMYPKGGSAMVTVRQVGQAIAGAVEKNRGGRCYPIGWYNLEWAQMLDIMKAALGCSNKKVVTIPGWMLGLGARQTKKQQVAQGIDGGLDMDHFVALQTSKVFIDKNLGSVELGVTDDDLAAAIGDSMQLCAQIMDGKTKAEGMRGE